MHHDATKDDPTKEKPADVPQRLPDDPASEAAMKAAKAKAVGPGNAPGATDDKPDALRKV